MMRMESVTFKYRVDSPEYFPATSYEQMTIEMEIEKNEEGFVMGPVEAKINEYIKKIKQVDAKIKNISLEWYRLNPPEVRKK